MATDKPRFSLTLDEDTLDRVIAYQQRAGLSTKSRAIQALVESGLEDYKEKNPPAHVEPREIEEGERLILQYFRTLSEDEKGFLLAVLQVLAEQKRQASPSPPAEADATD